MDGVFIIVYGVLIKVAGILVNIHSYVGVQTTTLC